VLFRSGSKLALGGITPTRPQFVRHCVPETSLKKRKRLGTAHDQIRNGDRGSDSGTTAQLAMRVTVRPQDDAASERCWRIEITPKHAEEILRCVDYVW